ncbi:MAG: hypothetical protein U9Q19_02685 [Pseudomonadota bacterium]|nr:hypothetical protein [Pseudomonadota bacterium]
MQSDGKLNLYRGTYLGTLLASGTTILTVGTWFYIELKCYMDDTNGEYELRINGNSEFSANTVDTRDDPDSNYASRVTFYNPYDTGDTYLDDIYILGDTANTAGGFLGDVSIETVMPNANGTQADFTRSAGASDWELVDEVPASDTDYLYSSTAADQVTVNFTDAGAGADIVAASLWTHCSIGSGGGRDIKLLCDSGATLDASASKRIRHDAALMEGYLVDPNTAAAWTLTNLNLAEFGIEIV